MAEADTSLITKIAGGDRAAMRELYERHAAAVRNFVRTRINDPIEAADIAQEVMLEVWRSAGKFAGGSAVRSWLLAIARNKANDSLRRRSRETPAESADLPDFPDEAPDAEAVIGAAQVSSKVRDCLDRLSAAHRSALHLIFFEDLTYPEIAAIDGVSVGTVKSRVHHAKQLMMHCLGRSSGAAASRPATAQRQN